MSKYVIEFDGYIPKTIEPIEQALDESYQKGFEAGQHEATTLEYQRGLDEGMARNEDGCIGCRYDDGTTEHSPCGYCCNAYSNQWMAKEKTDKIVVGDEVKDRTDDCGVVTWSYGNDAYVLWRDGSTGNYAADELVKTGRHFNFLTPLLEAMNGEQRNCHTCKHKVTSSIECVDCHGFGKWEPKEGE